VSERRPTVWATALITVSATLARMPAHYAETMIKAVRNAGLRAYDVVVVVRDSDNAGACGRNAIRPLASELSLPLLLLISWLSATE
jgi:hypothetical protein